MKNMSDTETIAHLREWVKHSHDVFSWPTDACGYDQHIRFVSWRNKHWANEHNKGKSFEQFVLDYADTLEKEINHG